jgi:hypothetical protein
MTMGDRVAVLRAGVLQQCSDPRELCECPASVFVAAFIGSSSINLYEASLEAGGDAGAVIVLGSQMSSGCTSSTRPREPRSRPQARRPIPADRPPPSWRPSRVYPGCGGASAWCAGQAAGKQRGSTGSEPVLTMARGWLT